MRKTCRIRSKEKNASPDSWTLDMLFGIRNLCLIHNVLICLSFFDMRATCYNKEIKHKYLRKNTRTLQKGQPNGIQPGKLGINFLQNNNLNTM